MPLKHHTETAYIVVLALVIALTGILLAWLPVSTQSVVAWIALAVLTGAYPLFLAPTLKSNRADYEFRWLHVFPFLMVVLWGIATLLALEFGWMLLLLPFTFVWSLPFVAIGFIALGIFCVAVVRRSHVRLRYLSVIFGMYLLLGGFAYLLDVNSTVTTALFDDTALGNNPVTAFFTASGSTVDVAKDTNKDEEYGSGSLVARAEERAEKRRQAHKNEERQKSSSSSSRHIVARSSSSSSSVSSMMARASSSSKASSSRASSSSSSSQSSRDSIFARASSASSRTSSVRTSSSSSSSSSSRRAVAMSSSSSSKPPKLPKSGGELGAIALLFLAVYSGVLHLRSRERSAA